jgi:hypothetical protein
MRRDQEGRQRQGLRTDDAAPAIQSTSRPSYFLTFDPMKEAPRGRRFSSDEEVIGAVQSWLKMQKKKKKT